MSVSFHGFEVSRREGCIWKWLTSEWCKFIKNKNSHVFTLQKKKLKISSFFLSIFLNPFSPLCIIHNIGLNLKKITQFNGFILTVGRSQSLGSLSIFMTCTGCAIKCSIKSVSLGGRNINVNNTYIGYLHALGEIYGYHIGCISYL